MNLEIRYLTSLRFLAVALLGWALMAPGAAQAVPIFESDFSDFFGQWKLQDTNLSVTQNASTTTGPESSRRAPRLAHWRHPQIRSPMRKQERRW